MILRILVPFSSPFSSWQISLYFTRRSPTINAMTHGPSMTSNWSSHFVGRQWHQMTGVLIGAMMMPNAFKVSSVTLRRPPCSKISGIPEKFPWAALEASSVEPSRCVRTPGIVRMGNMSVSHSRSLAFARIYWAQLRKFIFIGPQLQWTWQ